MTANHQTAAGVSVGIYTILAGLTLQEWAVVLGMIGVGITMFFQWRRDRREQRAFDYMTGKKPDRREVDCERCAEGKRATDETPA